MSISNMKERLETGMFNPTHKTRFINEKSLLVVDFLLLFILAFVFVVLMLFACGDIELNQGTKKRSSCYNISVCNWNLHSVNALNLTIIDILQAYNAM